ncbi:helix-turn-helix domain-containing protein [Dielma fastidiosa]|uniref:Helix-turn-helix domain containing protein n=1 Tax=Dielma fastidiosa TaxID=1034346 RepID=A0AB35UNM9_9FIRM|nr:helix-turn-helix domain-containing protein [Dielma fastidiosa]MDY5168209.1 helix-turn-helix domain containing protein [Dielma fastidiosa]
MKDRSRKTTYEERIEIVNYCLEHDKNYKDAAELFNVSYTQVYQWVNKYKEDGKKDSKTNEENGKRKNNSAKSSSYNAK